MSESAVQASPCRAALLGPGDPPPYEVVNGEGRARAVLICDHASSRVPAALDRLGLDESVLERHIGWDIGAADLTRRLALLIDAPAVLAGFSRLVIDCNRGLDSPASIVRFSDGVDIPGNGRLGEAAARARAEACFRPYHDAVEEVIGRLRAGHGRAPVIIAMHSFTPIFDGIERPWHVGILWHRDPHTAKPLIAALAADPAHRVGDNEPYSGRLPIPYSVPRHAEAPGLPHVTVEVRQDLIDTHHGADAWANVLAGALAGVLADPPRAADG